MLTHAEKHFGLYYILAIIAQILPLIFLIIVMLVVSANMFLRVVTLLLVIILNLVIQGAAVYVVYQSLRNSAVSVDDAISTVTTRLVLLVSIAVVCDITIGIMIFVIPGLIIMTMVAVIVPVCMMERLGTMDCINRSVELIKEYRLKNFVLVVIVGIVNAIINGIVNSILHPQSFPVLLSLTLYLALWVPFPRYYGICNVLRS